MSPCRSKAIVRTRVEPKVFFANERTFLAWLQISVLIMLTGLCELAGAVALLTKRLRWWAGVMLAAYTVCVYPANINHALNDIAVGGTRLGWGYHGPRLAFQPVIFWWCLFAGGVVDWPWRRQARAA